MIARAEKRKSNEGLKDLFVDFLNEKAKISYIKSYYLIGPKYALGGLVSQFLFYYVSEKDFTKQIYLLNELLHYIEGLQPSKNALLKKTTATNLLNSINNFGLLTSRLRTSNGMPLQIYFIPFEHVDVDAGYYPYINSIASYKPREKDLSAEYVFVHEVGHLLIYNITGDPEKVPDSFIEFNRKFNPEWDDDLVEVFVDLFSVAVMMDTEYAPLNPFVTEFSKKSQKVIKNYFIELVKGLQ